MEVLGPAPAAPTEEQLIEQLGDAVRKVMSEESSDENDPDRMYILRILHRNYTYYRDLQQRDSAGIAGIVEATGVAGAISTLGANDTQNDYSQNIVRGYCRKLEAVLGNRMPNAIATPTSSGDDESVRAVEAANSAVLYIREHCELQPKNLMLIFGLFNFGTNFWFVDWNVDEEKYGTKTVPDPNAPPTIPQKLGDASFNCPHCGATTPADENNPQPMPCPQCGAPLSLMDYKPPTEVQVPNNATISVAKGALEISLHDASEISVPLTAKSVDDPECGWLRYTREQHKAKLLANPEWGERLRAKAKDPKDLGTSSADQYAEKVRMAMASPLGIPRAKRTNQWTEDQVWWKPSMYQLIDDAEKRKLLLQNFPKGLRYRVVRGTMVSMKSGTLAEDWRDVPPEPCKRIMADPLANDWIQPQDMLNDNLNQCMETIERSNEPGFADPRRLDFDAYQDRRSEPCDLFAALPPPGRPLSDIIYRPEPNKFSEQIAPFNAGVEERAKNISGLLDPIWGGGDANEPTARQAELKKNAALMQLGVQWTMICRAQEHLYMQACRKLAQHEDGVLAFSKKNQFGEFDHISIAIADLNSDKYRIQADEAIPMTWGQQRDLLMWMLDKPAPLLTQWGIDDPLNIFTNKQLLGMPGERTPGLDTRNKGMAVIGKLLLSPPTPAAPDANGQPGEPQPTIAPDWEDDHAFCAKLANAYLTVNYELKDSNPDGYANVQAWGKAQDKIANQPPPPTPPKTSVALSLKGADLGDPAVQAAAEGAGIVPPGTPVAAVIPPPKNGDMPHPGTNTVMTGPPQ